MPMFQRRELVLHCTQSSSLLHNALGHLRLCTPSRLPFAQSVGAAILVFWQSDVVGTGCSWILLVGMANSRFFFLGSFAALAKSSKFQFCAFCCTYHTRVLVHLLGLCQQFSFYLRSIVLFGADDTVLCSAHIYRNESNNPSFVAPSCLPSILRALC